MSTIILAVVILTVLGLIFFPRKAIAGEKEDIPIVKGVPAPTKNIKIDSVGNTPHETIFRKYANIHNVDWRLISGIAFTESNYNPMAVNYADNESIGIMQVLCRPDGKGGCANLFPAISEWKEITREKLFDIEQNINIGVGILAWNISQYGVSKGIAVYNSWDQRNRNREGPFKNQFYVDKVLKRAKELGYET